MAGKAMIREEGADVGVEADGFGVADQREG